MSQAKETPKSALEVYLGWIASQEIIKNLAPFPP